MAKSWADYAASPAFTELDRDQQEQARVQYFNDVVRPQFRPEEARAAWRQFDRDTALAPPQPKPKPEPDRGFWSGVGQTVGAAYEALSQPGDDTGPTEPVELKAPPAPAAQTNAVPVANERPHAPPTGAAENTVASASRRGHASTDDAAPDAAPAASAPSDYGIAEFGQDVGASGLNAINSFAETSYELADAATRLAPGSTSLDDVLPMRKNFAQTRQFYNTLHSDTFNQQQQRANQAKGLIGSAKATVTNPLVAMDLAITSAPYALGMAGPVRAAGKRAFAQAIKNGASQKAARAAATKAGGKASIAANAAIGGAAGSQQARQQVNGMSRKELLRAPAYRELLQAGNSDTEARRIISDRAAKYAGALSTAISGAASGLTAGMESRLFTGMMTKAGGPVSFALKTTGAAGRETAEELTQEGGEGFAGNVGQKLSGADPDRGLMQGVPEQAGPAAVLGFGTGVGITSAEQAASAGNQSNADEGLRRAATGEDVDDAQARALRAKGYLTADANGRADLSDAGRKRMQARFDKENAKTGPKAGSKTDKRRARRGNNAAADAAVAKVARGEPLTGADQQALVAAGYAERGETGDLAARPSLQKRIDELAGVTDQPGESAATAGEAAWQLPRSSFYADTANNGIDHEAEVENAIARGERVPVDVLTDYPRLSQMAAERAQAPPDRSEKTQTGAAPASEAGLDAALAKRARGDKLKPAERRALVAAGLVVKGPHGLRLTRAGAERMNARAAAAKPARAAPGADTTPAADMSAADLRAALTTDARTGLGNRRAFDEAQAADPKPNVGLADLDGLKFVNDTFGHEAGDQLLNAAAHALHTSHDNSAYRLQGDEFAVRGNNQAENDAALTAANAILGQTQLTFTRPDGTPETHKGFGFSYGTGKTLNDADAGLQADKQARTRAGQRSGRGQAPGAALGNTTQGDESQPETARRDDDRTRHEVADAPIVDVAVDDLAVSADVPQFKAGADAAGVVEPLGGTFEPTGVAPIQVWQRNNGKQEVISGRHRLDLAKRSGQTTIPAQIHREADGMTPAKAAMLDAELNIRDEQGQVSDYAAYFKNTGLDQSEAESRGLLARAKGRTGFALASQAADPVYAAHQAGRITDAAAEQIAAAAPNNEALQAAGLDALQNGASIADAANTVRAVASIAGPEAEQGDLFGFDDSAMRDARAMAKIASAKQRAIRARIASVRGAAKRPETAREMGVDVKDPAAVNAEIARLADEAARWDDWNTDPDLVAQIRAEMRDPSARPPAGNANATRPASTESGAPAGEASRQGSLDSANEPDSNQPDTPDAPTKREQPKPAAVQPGAAQAPPADVFDTGATDATQTLDGITPPTPASPGTMEGDNRRQQPTQPARNSGRSADYGKANQMFTEDAAAAARATLRRKLGQVNSGFDPETMQAGLTLAGYHVEAGARSFAHYARAMIADMGEAVRPYLKSFYNGVRDYPGFDATGMDSYEAVRAIDADRVAREPAATDDAARHDSAPTARPAFDLDTDTPARFTILDATTAALAAGDPLPQSHNALKRWVAEQYADVAAKDIDNAALKRAQEQIEAGIVSHLRARYPELRGQDNQAQFDAFVATYNAQPAQNIRTSTSVANQAYSTPAPLAWLAGKAAGALDTDARVLEPSAGTGILAIGKPPGSPVTLNEINDYRANMLRAQGYTVTQADAVTADFGSGYGAVIANPPFGSLAQATGKKEIRVDGFKLNKIDHVIAANALGSLADDGRAAVILGAGRDPSTRSEADRIFYNWLYSHYNVTDHYEVSGDLYRGQGAGWPVALVTVNGRHASATYAPDPATIPRYTGWQEALAHYEQNKQNPVADGVDTGDRAVGGRRSDPGGDETARPADDARSAPSPDAGQDRGPDPGRGQPGRSRGSGRTDGHTRVSDLSQQRDGAGGQRSQSPNDGGSDRPDRLGEQPGTDQPDRSRANDSRAKPDGNARAAESGDAGLDASAYQVAYRPAAGGAGDGILIPRNLAGPTTRALDRLRARVGDLNAYVRARLGYASQADLDNAFMGAQVDAVAAAIDQIEAGQGVVIADQTGIGKGRMAAAVLRYAHRQGRTPVFITEKDSLFTAMADDLADIGSGDLRPFLMNDKAFIEQNGRRRYHLKPAARSAGLKRMAAGQMPADANVIFATYSQFRVDNRQRTALSGIAPGAILVLDESHSAAGSSATGAYLRGVLGAARGATYLSATYAKRPDSMPLYRKTDLGAAVDDIDTLIEAMEAGGVPLQTVVSNMLAESGQLFRRERSYAGVEIATEIDHANRAAHERISDAVTAALRAIVSADRAFHEGYVKQADKDARAAAKRISSGGNQAGAGVTHTNFTSVVHNVIGQMLLATKAETAAARAIEAIESGRKPVIGLESTFGSFLDQYTREQGIRAGDALTGYDFRAVLQRSLDRSRRVQEKQPTGSSLARDVALDELDLATRSAYRDAQAAIDAVDADVLDQLTVSPIDWIRHRLVAAGYSVKEITGREQRVDYSAGPEATLAAIEPDERNKVATRNAFNDGSLDALVINAAGATGISLHASENFADQRPRQMIIAQAPRDINTFIQMLGRVHRTGQVVDPSYSILTLDLPTEKRPTAVLSRKMKSLDANTTANDESETSVDAPDILNKYGDDTVAEYLAENPTVNRFLDVAGGEGVARQATGRLALMAIDDQRAFYQDVEANYNALIDYLDKTGQNDLKPATLDLDARAPDETITVAEGRAPGTPFGDDAKLGLYDVKAQGKPPAWAEVQAAVDEALAGRSASDYAATIIAARDDAFSDYQAGTRRALEKAEADRAAARTDKQKAAADTAVVNARQRVESEAAGAERARALIRSMAPGTVHALTIEGETYTGVATGLRAAEAGRGNPYAPSKTRVAFMLDSGMRTLTLPGTRLSGPDSVLAPASTVDAETAFDNAAARDERESRWIATGNLVAAMGELQKGQIATYTTAADETAQGIVLPASFDPDSALAGDQIMRLPEAVYAFLTDAARGSDRARFGVATRDARNGARVVPKNGGIAIQVPKAKARGGPYYLDPALLKHSGDFVAIGDRMEATVTDRDQAIAAIAEVQRIKPVYAPASIAETAAEYNNRFRTRAADAGPQPDAGDARYSRPGPSDGSGGQRQAGLDVPGLRAALKARFGPGVARLEARGTLQLVATDAELPRDLQNQGARGVVLGADDRVYLVADRLDAASVKGVFLHEVGVHYGLANMLGDTGFAEALERMRALRAAGNAAVSAAYARVPGDTPAHQRDEEALGYLVEAQPSLPFLRRVIAALKTFLYRHFGIGRARLGADEMTALARASAARATADGAARTAGPAPADSATGPRTAPNGKPSNLNARQHAQVRTPAFRRWFGDWLGASHRRFLDGPAISNVSSDAFAPDGEKLTEKVARWYRENHNNRVDVPGIGEVALTRRSVKDSIAPPHGLNRAKAAAFQAVPDVLTHGRMIDDNQLRGSENQADRAYTFAAPIAIGDNAYIAAVVVKREQDTQRMYVHEVTLREKFQGATFKTGALPETGQRTGVAPGTINTLLRNIYAVNPDGVSQIVDENGEPRVVYHGTVQDVAAFDPAQSQELTPLFYAAADTETAGHFASYRRSAVGSNVMPLFMNLRNPLVVDGDYAPIREAEARAERSLSDARDGETLAEYAARAHDGVIYQNVVDDVPNAPTSPRATTIYAATKPGQIKSATANQGPFDPANPDIRYSRIGDEMAPGAGADAADTAGGPRSAPTTRVRGQLYDANGDVFAPPAQNRATARPIHAHPITLAEAEALANTDLAMRFATRGPETTGGQGWFIDQRKLARALAEYDNTPRGAPQAGLHQRLNARQAQIVRAARDREEVTFGHNVGADGDARWYRISRAGRAPSPRTRFDEPLFSRADEASDGAPARASTVARRDVRLIGRDADGRTRAAARVVDGRWHIVAETADGLGYGVDTAATRAEAEDKLRGQGFAVDLEAPRRAASRQSELDLATVEPPAQGYFGRAAGTAQFIAQDKFNSLARLQNAAEAGRGERLDDAADAYRHEVLAHGRTRERFTTFDETEIHPLLDDLGASGFGLRGLVDYAPDLDAEIAARYGHLTAVDAYLYARHAPEANRRLATQNPGEPAMSGMADADAEAIMAALEDRGESAALAAIGARVDRINQKSRDWLVDSGLESQALMDDWAATYDYYVPLKTDPDGPTASGAKRFVRRAGRGFDTRGPAAQRRLGRRSPAAHILANTVAGHYDTIARGERNGVAQAMLRFAQENPSSWYTVDQPMMKRALDPVTGLVTRVPDGAARQQDNVFVVRVAGVEHHIAFDESNDEAMRLAKSLKNLGSTEMGAVLKLLKATGAYLSLVRTGLSPEFVFITNFTRDLQTAALNLNSTDAKRMKRRILKDAATTKASRAIWRWQAGRRDDEWARWAGEFLADGGATGWMEGYGSIAAFNKDLTRRLDRMQPGSWAFAKRSAHNVYEFIHRTNNAVENGVRLATYVHLRRDGLSRARAAQTAKEITVNFNRKGDKGDWLNGAYLFYNASVQGSARILKNAYESPEARRWMAAAVGGGTAQFLAGYMLAGDDDDDRNRYEAIPGYVKRNNWVVMAAAPDWMPDYFKGPEGDYFKFPMPYGYNVLNVIGQKIGRGALAATGEIADYNPADDALDVALATIDSFNPLGGGEDPRQIAAPTLTRPAVDWAINKNFAGIPIHPAKDPYAVAPEPAYKLHFSGARAWSKWATKHANRATGGSEVEPGFVNISPELVDYMTDFIFGSVGKSAAEAAQLPGRLAGSADLNAYQIPFIGKLYGTPMQNAGRSLYYQRRTDIEYLRKAVINARRNDAAAERARLQREHPGEIKMVPVMRGIDARLRAIGRRENKIAEARTLTGREKNRRIDRLEAEQARLYHAFNRRYKALVLAEQGPDHKAQPQRQPAEKQAAEAE